jgi:hypothetical protein
MTKERVMTKKPPVQVEEPSRVKTITVEIDADAEGAEDLPDRMRLGDRWPALLALAVQGKMMAEPVEFTVNEDERAMLLALRDLPPEARLYVWGAIEGILSYTAGNTAERFAHHLATKRAVGKGFAVKLEPAPKIDVDPLGG